ncbi:hypothetical protein PAHAL_5G158300 [Panicum hallii]|uniref:Uncharacterized protein n=1 Tax=Panicum hallii TaxID=206008 RepID=A0A2S3HRP8_9POAL|nr:hypothetical protein PAHAL_5G158300 [Panicum hallii]
MRARRIHPQLSLPTCGARAVRPLLPVTAGSSICFCATGTEPAGTAAPRTRQGGAKPRRGTGGRLLPIAAATFRAAVIGMDASNSACVAVRRVGVAHDAVRARRSEREFCEQSGQRRGGDPKAR